MWVKSLLLLLLVIAPVFQTYFIDPQYKLGPWSGWGTSMQSFTNVLGGLEQNVQDEIVHALFSPEKLNLNILRYVIGGTTPGDPTCQPYRQGAATESFRDGIDKPYIWTRDPRSRRILLAAKNLGVNIFEAYSDSPPSWMTRSGCTKGNPEGAPLHDNFDAKFAPAFADYLTEVVKHYQEVYNVSFTTIAPYQSPTSRAFKGNGTQEGCNMEISTMTTLVKNIHASLLLKNLSFCSISVADERGINEELQTQKHFAEAGVSSMYTKINVHGYTTKDDDKRAELFTLADRHGHALWMDNFGLQGSSLENMTQGLNLAERIILDLRNLVPSAWVYSQAAYDRTTSTIGLVSVPYDNSSVANIKYHSGYYAMKQFSQHIKNGFTLIHVNDRDSIAAYDATTETLVLVTLNNEESFISKEFDLHGFASFGQVLAIRTSSYEPHVAVPPPEIIGKFLNFDYPPRSITTIKILEAKLVSFKNLVTNGDFEGGLTSPWFLMYGEQQDNGVNGKYVYRGRLSGFVDYSESKLSLMQNVTVTESRTFRLSAWCATTGPNTRVGILVNGNHGTEETILPSAGYQLYGLSVDAKRQDVLTIYLHAEVGNYTAQIDDVVLH